jgi:peptidoglycan/LPS O-acetylase OafA/YrhL
VERIPSLDGLRALSISVVVLSHLAKSGHAPRVFWSYFGATGVSIFFVISGYLITTLLMKEKERTDEIKLRRFYVRRALRIFPAAMLFLLIISITYRHELTWYHMLMALLYLANYDATRPWILGHLWSLSIEEQFYLLWPGILKTCYRWRLATLAAVMALAPLWQVMSYALKWRLGLGAFPASADNLAIGCLLAMLGHKLPAVGKWMALLMLAGVVAIPFFPANTESRTVFMLFVLRPLFYTSIAGLVLHVVRRPYWLLNWSPVVWLGRISYSLYLWQQPFCADPKLRHGYFVIFALLCACLSYYLVESPILKLRDATNKNKSKVQHAAEVMVAA